jgi:hypothetical protein
VYAACKRTRRGVRRIVRQSRERRLVGSSETYAMTRRVRRKLRILQRLGQHTSAYVSIRQHTRRVRRKLRILQRLGGGGERKEKEKKDVTAPTKRKHMFAALSKPTKLKLS